MKGRKPGWYLDPNGLGHERYWDGENWTHQVRNETPWGRVAPGGGKPLETSQRKWWKRKK